MVKEIKVALSKKRKSLAWYENHKESLKEKRRSKKVLDKEEENSDSDSSDSDDRGRKNEKRAKAEVVGSSSSSTYVRHWHT